MGCELLIAYSFYIIACGVEQGENGCGGTGDSGKSPVMGTVSKQESGYIWDLFLGRTVRPWERVEVDHEEMTGIRHDSNGIMFTKIRNPKGGARGKKTEKGHANLVSMRHPSKNIK